MNDLFLPGKKKLLNYFTCMLVSDRTLEVTWGRNGFGTSQGIFLSLSPSSLILGIILLKKTVLLSSFVTQGEGGSHMLTIWPNLHSWTILNLGVWNQDPMTPKYIVLFTIPRFLVYPHSSHELSAHPGPSDHRFYSPLFASTRCTCIQVGRPFSS